MAISYGTYTITDIQEGSQIWTTSVAPTTPNYTFTISNLTGDSDASVKVGDIIMYNSYRYTVSNINSDGTTVLTGDRTSIKGDTGASATTYHLITSTLAIVKGSNNSLSPSSIVLTAKSQSGSNAMSNYSGRFKIETTTDNSTWTTKYTSSGNEATKTYTLPTDIVAVRCSLYLAGGTSTLLDQQTIPVVSNGANGTSVSITSTSVTYQSGTSGTTKPTGTWQTTVPSVSQGNYLWTKTIVNYSDGSSTESYSVARQGNNGSNGTSPTVSTTTVQYQQSTNGSTPPSGTWSDNPPTAIAGQYMWTKTIIKYSDNAEATSYSVSKNGTNGTNGSSVSITSTSVTYQSGTSGTSKPTGTWQTTIPSVAQGNYLWTKTVVNYSDGTSTESYSAARQGSNGTNGTNGTSPTVSSTVVEYQQSTDGKNVPTGTWSTTPPTAVAGQYIWTRTTITYSDNATAVSYSVGKNGTNGNSITITSTSVTYQKGTSGTTKPTGSWGTSIPSVGEGEYLWTKTVVSYSDGKSTESYSVSRNATNGINGTSPTVSSTVTEYAQSTDGVNKPTSGWNTTPPTAIPEQYIWSRVTVTYSDNATAVSYSVSRNGTNGTSISISSTAVTYQKGTSGTTKPTGTWQSSIPSVGQGEYLWTKTVVTYSDTSKTESYSVSRNAVNGTNGTNGRDGVSPTVSSTVTEYVQSDSGTNTPTSGWSTTPPSATAGKYMWTKVTVTYSDNATAISYTVSKNGTNGTNGINTATVYLYKKSTTAPSVPSGDTTYTFSTKKLTGTLDSWTQEIPTTGSGQCYVIAAVASSNGTTDTIGTGEWSTPIQFNGTNGTNGTNGLNQATIFLYKRGASVTKPTTSATYTFSTGDLSPEPNDWKRNILPIDGNPCWVVSATAIGNGTNVTIAGNNWSAPVKLVEDGADGNDAYTVSLSNDNHTFAGDTTKAIQANVDCSVIGYKGATQVAVTIGTISGEPTGMTTSKTNNGTTNAYFTVSVTTAMTTRNGVLTIPVTIDGKSFTKKFTYSLALKGDKGDKGDSGGIWYSGTAITGTSTTATVFSNSGITSAVVGDMYLNTTTYNTYRCTVAGNASTAKWVYVNNIKGGKGDVGNTGKGISSIKNQYYLSTSNTTQVDGGSWTDTVPTYVSGKYYWTRSYIVWSDNTNTTTNPVLDNALTSANSTAKQAKDIADNTAQYFWVSSDTTDSGVHITEVPQADFVADRENGGGNLLAKSNGIIVRDGLSELAKFGSDGVQIGVDNNSKFRLFDKGIYGYNNNGANFFALDMNGSNSAVTVQEKYNSKKYWYNYQRQSNGDCIITIPDNCKNDYLNKLYIKYGRRYNGVGGIYDTTYSTYFTFILGTAKEDEFFIGAVYDHRTHELISYNYRVSFSYDGNNTLTLHINAGVFEDNTIYYFFYLDYLLYQTITTAPAFTFGTRDTAYTLGDFSTTFGLNNAASGVESIAIGDGSIAASNYQTAIGKFNISDSANTYSFIIGNGTAETPSNAFTVGWDGNVELCIDTSASSGTIDGDLYAAIVSLGWESEVIV